MGSVNKVILVGNLGRDAELRFTTGGTAVSKFSVATTETWTDKNGQRQERTEWHNIELWGKVAESLQDYLVKGKQVYVEGKLQTDKYTDKDGVERKATKIRADKLTLLSGGSSARTAGGRREEAEPESGGYDHSAPLTDDDIPF